jgi:phospholipid/cholesterol/gamma-HCH transport system substrate-binding protein
LVLGLAAWGAVQVAQRHWNWQATFRLQTAFSRVGGLAAGDSVRLQGMNAGVVESIEAPRKPGGKIIVMLRIDNHLQQLIRSDAVAMIVANAVGPKVVEILPGKPDAPPLPEGGTLLSTDPIELGDLLIAGKNTMQQLEGITREAEIGMKQINLITGAISRGEGTLGKLVREDAAYNQVMALAQRTDRAVGALNDNLSAMKGVFPFSGFFQNRGFDEMERVLYRPDANRESKVLAADLIFAPGKAILTNAGTEALDDYAKWFKARRWPDNTDVVIAVFTDEPKDPDAARILTEDRARAVKIYFDQKHKLFDLPFLRQRKVAAVGYGTQKPKPEPTASAGNENAPASRVEIVLFTPKAPS